MATTDDPRDMLVQCALCDGSVIGKPVGHYVYYDPEEGLPERWTLLACAGAGHPILVVQYQYGSFMDFDDDSPWRAYPPQEGVLSLKIPEELRDNHAEARRCFAAKSYTATAVMCGRTLEMLCAVQGAEKRTLQASLEEMKNRGLMDEKLWKWTDTLRDVRNTAAHGGVKSMKQVPIGRQDAEDSLALNEALLDYIYVLTERFRAFEERRNPKAS